MSISAEASEPSLLRHRSFVLLWCARTFTTAAFQMQGVAVGYQLYELTNDPLDLGIVGLVQFVPLVALSLVIGHIADRYDRRAVARACQIVKAIVAAALAFGSFEGWINREVFFALLFVAGTARAFEMPVMHALVPGIVPAPMLPRAIAAAASAQQTAIICGPAVGGLIYWLAGPAATYGTCMAIFIGAAVLVSLMHVGAAKQEKKPVSLESLFAGFTFILKRQVLLGVISLDLFAVLLGGVTALLPIYARDILHVDAWGLGLLRSAPAVGALISSAVLAHYSIERSAGRILFLMVAAYGTCILVFGLSTSLVLSVIALAGYGAADAISVVIRHSMVQSRTPNEMLGRVMAVNSMFTGTSGTLGEFRAGAMAAWLGAVPAAVFGGIGAVIVTLVWMRAFPDLTKINKLTADK
jgi:MFS family permease